MSTPFVHLPVLLSEVCAALLLRPDSLIVDCTAGGGGHSSEILRQLGPAGRLIALDRDPVAVGAATERLQATAASLGEDAPLWEVVHSPFSSLDSVLAERGIAPNTVDGLFADLGVSSPQLDVPDRGFSFMSDGPLDMRMDRTCGETAAELVNRLSEYDLAEVLFRLGDEKRSRRIAKELVRRREELPFERTSDLASFIEEVLGGRRGSRTHPATKSFQALRMKVNGELDQLETLLGAGLRWLKEGGRWAIITFHSGEDRPVKRRFTELSRDCICPPAQPVCTCTHRAQLRLPRPWSFAASESELHLNSRARSARLRVAERLMPMESADA